ncbi:MAG: hypothetical protein ABIQ16_00130 [Polyangiaceae bacterium]
MPKMHKTTPAAWLASLVIVPALLADCGGSSSTGDAAAGSISVGGGGDATCATPDCGPALGLANYQCPDGSTAGPTGRCLKRDNGTCGWEVLSCPTASGGSGASGSAGAGGQASGGATGQLCGGQVCSADQVCCGPAVCGRCISKLSGQYCLTQCSGGSGGTGSGGASGGAGGADCTSLLATVQATVTTAQGCNTASAKPTTECGGTLEGLCCPVLVETADSNDAANTAYLNALHAYKQSCSHACPKAACFNPQPGNCVAAQGSTLGTCGGGNGLF